MAAAGQGIKIIIPPLPASTPIEEIKPKLKVFRRGSLNEIAIDHNEITGDKMGSGIRDAEKLVFIVHGFLNTGDDEWIQEMKDALLEAEDQIVVVVAWGGGANLNPAQYTQAASNIRTVGQWLGGCVKEIKALNPNIILHGIGHSLGAHVLGMAGRESQNFDRISGLDPSGPCFENPIWSDRGLEGLRSTDARMVDVIHTCCYYGPKDVAASHANKNHYGKFAPMGTVDFYPNYGYMQPGTYAPVWANTGKSHQRAHQYFTWSIRNKGKLTTTDELEEAPHSDNIEPKYNRGPEVEMGYYADAGGRNPRGNYYIEINAENPPWK